MIRYRKSQKEFALPLMAAAGGLMNIGFLGSSVAGMIQGSKGNKLMQEQNAEMERANREQQKIEEQRLEQEKKWQEQQLKLQKKALKQGVNPFGDSSILNNTTGTPTTPLQPPPPIAQGNFSKIDGEEQREYSVFSFAKDMALLATRNKGVFINGIMAGAATSAGVAVADKAVRRDKESREDDAKKKEKSSSPETNSERTYSRTKVSFKGPIFSFALGASAPLISYAVEKKISNDVVNDTIVEDSEEDNSETKDKKNSQRTPKYKEKTYAVPVVAARVAGTAIKAGKTVKKTSKVLNALSIISGGGGAKGMRNLGIQLSAIGKKSGNKATKKLGQAILNNPNTAMALSIPGGLAVFSGTFSLGDKIASKAIKKSDPDAYSYIESKDKEV